MPTKKRYRLYTCKNKAKNKKALANEKVINFKKSSSVILTPCSDIEISSQQSGVVNQVRFFLLDYS